MRRVVLAVVAVLALAGLAAYRYQDGLRALVAGQADPGFILVSGNIEAHESILSFKSVQSRIVELPFDEGQTVKAGTTIAKVDDADYRQEVTIAQATLDERRSSWTSQSRTSPQRAARSSAIRPK